MGRTDHNIRLRFLDSLPHRLHVLCISGVDYRVALLKLFDYTADQARGSLGSGVACALCKVIYSILFEVTRYLTSLYGPLGDIVRSGIVQCNTDGAVASLPRRNRSRNCIEIQGSGATPRVASSARLVRFTEYQQLAQA